MTTTRNFMIRDDKGNLSPGGYSMFDAWKSGAWKRNHGRAYNSVGAVKRSLRGMLRVTGRKRIPRTWNVVEVSRISTRRTGIAASQLVITDPLALALESRFNKAPRSRR